jgi:hypothetical protein
MPSPYLCLDQLPQRLKLAHIGQRPGNRSPDDPEPCKGDLASRAPLQGFFCWMSAFPGRCPGLPWVALSGLDSAERPDP